MRLGPTPLRLGLSGGSQTGPWTPIATFAALAIEGRCISTPSVGVIAELRAGATSAAAVGTIIIGGTSTKLSRRIETGTETYELADLPAPGTSEGAARTTQVGATIITPDGRVTDMRMIVYLQGGSTAAGQLVLPPAGPACGFAPPAFEEIQRP